MAMLSNDDLAPPPSSEEVFGEKMEQITSEYQEDSERLNHQLTENKERQAHSLEEKLAARRQRRARVRLEEKEKKAYAEDGGGA